MVCFFRQFTNLALVCDICIGNNDTNTYTVCESLLGSSGNQTHYLRKQCQHREGSLRVLPTPRTGDKA